MEDEMSKALGKQGMKKPSKEEIEKIRIEEEQLLVGERRQRGRKWEQSDNGNNRTQSKILEALENLEYQQKKTNSYLRSLFVVGFFVLAEIIFVRNLFDLNW